MTRKPGSKKKASGPQKAKKEYFLKVRTYTGGEAIADVWFVARDGDTLMCMLHGEMFEKNAIALTDFLEQLGVRVEREKSPFEGKRVDKRIEDNRKSTKTKSGLTTQQDGFF